MLVPPIFLGFLSSAANEFFSKGAKHLLSRINQRWWQQGCFGVVVRGQLTAAQHSALSCMLMELDQDSLPSQPKADSDESTVKLFGEALWGQKKRRAH